MANWRDDVKKDYEDFKKQFGEKSFEEFQSGEWFSQFVKWLLEEYAKKVDASYIRKMYPGAGSANQAKKAITLAAKYNGIAGGTSAAAITALELSSIGPQAVVTVPAVGVTVIADVAYSTRTQLRTTYDLSVIHGAPLSMDDIEDCYMIFMIAMGVKIGEIIGTAGKSLGPRIATYNVRILLRAGLRKALQEILKKLGGTQLARKLTERAMMRLLVPGINIPIGSALNYYFTRLILRVANRQMIRRAAVIQPLVRLYKRRPELEKTFAIKVFISVANCGDPEGWSEGQMDALRQCQSALSLNDNDLADLDNYFDREIDDVLSEMPDLGEKAAADLLELSIAVAALFHDDQYDPGYSEAISKLSTKRGEYLSQSEAEILIKKKRAKIL